MIGAGGVLSLDGALIHSYYNQDDSCNCTCAANTHIDLHGEQKFISVEFAGTLISLVCYVSVCMLHAWTGF